MMLSYPDTPVALNVKRKCSGQDSHGDYEEEFQLRGLKTTLSSRTNDDVHSSIHLCPLMIAILDTPQMQRLRGLKQLGVSEMTYIPTTHNRFEHSLGVAALSQKVLLEIAKKQPRLGITEKDIVCVKLAGLLHDIGHGPFSHIYDGDLRKQLHRAEREGVWLGQKFDKGKYDDMPSSIEGWVHEDGSIMMIDALLQYLGMTIDEDNLDAPLKQIGSGINVNCFGIYDFVLSQSTDNSCYDGITPLPNHLVLTSRDWIFIKECIVGGPLPPNGMSVGVAKKLPDLVLELVGRPDVYKEFLYDIVSNRHSGLDVDKIDYLARDERRAYGAAGEVDPLMVENAHVAWGECPRPAKCYRCKHHINRKRKICDDNCDKESMHLMICYPEKMVQNAMNFFKGRFRNHEHLYTHSNTNAASYMVCDILLLADQFIRLSTVNEGDGTSTYSMRKDDYAYNESVSITRANTHPEAYVRLKDSILDIIAVSDSPNLKPARVLLNRFRAHKMYKKVAHLQITSSNGIEIDQPWQNQLWEMDELAIATEIVKCGELQDCSSISLKQDDIIVEKRIIHHGMKAANPVSFMRFLPKSQLTGLRESPENLPIAREIIEKEYECSIPRAFLQRTVRIYCRNYSRDVCDFLQTCYYQFIEHTKKKNAHLHDNNEYDREVSNGFNGPNLLSQSPFRSEMSNSNSSGNGAIVEPKMKHPRKSLFSRLEDPDSPLHK